ncbi:RNA-binding domain-containing protein [Deinococcus radiotolerans]|uniref:Schlafen AlbA-2 domain-containing protein n=1 Tax=Deinococcus radiotolerans TaxID=1309407 RepID=A0ABQ2FQE4_9DEIO|nr:RNA-binding domain-containing protein [Deinococcus radiotolerans]GGL16529.1 hypothetical protein GCM10010844_39250 [Deinococcus radiotolerans]
MAFDPTDPASLEAFLREQIKRGRERDKLDFKQAWLSGAEQPKKGVNQQAKLELIKDINAMANTYSLDFEDYGFLILGVTRADKRITTDVPNLRDPGVDNLEASIAQWLAEHMEPQPDFSLHAFEEPGVGTWGALIIEPNQSPPFVFKKDGTYQLPSGKTDKMWHEGEWRLRRNAVTIRPQPRDYTEVLRIRIQSAMEPLHREVAALRQQVYQLEGRIQGLQQANQAEIEVALETSGQPVDAVTFTTARQAGEGVLAEYQPKIKALHEKVASRPPERAERLERQMRTQYGWYDLVTLFDAFLKDPTSVHRGSWNMSELLPFMHTWNLDVQESDRLFPQAGYYRPNNRDSSRPMALLGPDTARAEAYLELLTLSRDLKPQVEKAANRAPYREFQLRFANISAVSAGALRFELRCISGASIYQFAPGPKGSGSVFGATLTKDAPMRLPVFEGARPELFPGDVWIPPVFALKFGEAASTVLLEGTLWAANLPTPKTFRLDFQATPTAQTD